MDNPVLIAVLLTTAVALLCYALFVPKNKGKLITNSEKSDNGLINAAEMIGNELYAILPEGVGKPRARSANPRIDSLIQRSGNPWKLKSEQFIFYQIITGFLGLIVGILAGLLVSAIMPALPWYIVGIAGAIFGFFIPQINYGEAAKKRDLEFKRQLPEALDLLIISLAGGTTFQMAIRESLENMQPGVLRDEFREIVKSIDTGKTLSEALSNFAARAPNDAITTFVKAVQESTELSVPIIETLEQRAEASRQEFFAIIHAKTATLDSRMMMVLTPTLIPAMLITVLTPAVFSFMESMGDASF